MLLLITLKTIKPLTCLLPDFLKDQRLTYRRMWQFSPSVKDWADNHPNNKEGIQCAYNQLREEEQLLYRTYILEVSAEANIQRVIRYFSNIKEVASVEVG